MAILAHAQKYKVQHRLIIFGGPQRVPKVSFRFARGFFGRRLARDPVNPLGWNLKRNEKQFPRSGIVAFHICGWHAPLVAPEEMHGAQFLLCLGSARDLQEKPPGNAPPR